MVVVAAYAHDLVVRDLDEDAADRGADPAEAPDGAHVALGHARRSFAGDENRVLVERKESLRLRRGGVAGPRQPPSPCRQNSQVSSAVTRVRGFSTRRLPDPPVITLLWVSTAASPRPAHL